MKKLALLLGLAMFLSTPATFAQTAPQNQPGAFPPAFSGHHMCRHNHDNLKQELNLTQDQQTKAKAMREQSRAQIKPIIDQMRAERQKFREMRKQNASQEALNAQQEKIRGIMEQAKAIHKQNLQNFESILTPEQKTKFESIKKQRMEQHKKWQEGMKNRHGNFGGRGFNPSEK